MCKALRELRRFILVKCAEGNPSHVREYVIDNIDHLARAFHVPASTIMVAVESTTNDLTLAERLLETIMRAEHVIRRSRKERRAKAAQQSADILSSTIVWDEDRAVIDMPSLLSSVLTRREDVLLFIGSDFTVSIPMAPLLDLSRIARVRADLTGSVSREGLTLRWRTGGLNLRSHDDTARAEKITLHLPPMPSVIAA